MNSKLRFTLFFGFTLGVVVLGAGITLAQTTPASSNSQRPAASVDNAELKTLFVEDQHDRGVEPFPVFDEHGKQVAPKTWPVLPDAIIEKHNAERRLRARQLLGLDAVKTSEDYWLAAMIFHHGDKPEDYLLAHVLAITAAYKGNRNGRWLAAAALDRYLLSVSQKQIYGTQFTGKRGDTVQADYAPDVLDDQLRAVSCVISQGVQHKQWLAFQSGQGADANTTLLSCLVGSD